MLAEHLTDLWAYANDPNASPLSAEGRAAALALMIAQGQYAEAYTASRADKVLTDAEKKQILAQINQNILFARNLEWTNHGVRRTFRFWSVEEKTHYIKRTNDLVHVLRDFTPHVALGFGSVLSLIRDKDFIPHDDDMDLIIALEPSTFDDAKQRLKAFLAERGFTCHGENLTHYGVNSGGKEAAIDVFIGFRDEDRISWFPSHRNGLEFSEVFPTQTQEFFGHMVPVPANPKRYLEVTYGPDWRQPIANWGHPWDASQYQDYC